MPDTTFQARWLTRLGLPPANWREAAATHLQSLPFLDAAEKKTAHKLLCHLLDTLPPKLAKDDSAATARLAEAFGRVCLAFWQCGSAFPSFPQNYAVFLRDQLRLPPRRRQKAAALLVDLLLGTQTIDDLRCGLNQLVLKDAKIIRESERLMKEGRFDFYVKAWEKYTEFEAQLREHPELAAEWILLKKQFPEQTSASGILHRTLIPERNWDCGPGAQFETEAQCFQATFDLFCWKYYLWGMQGDNPLLLKPSVTFTPFGTQIFIPGYLSFNATLDLHFDRITKLHKARGVRRQGPGFSKGRTERAELKRKARVANSEAKKLGLRGDKRYEHIAQKLKLKDSGDYRATRRLLE